MLRLKKVFKRIPHVSVIQFPPPGGLFLSTFYTGEEMYNRQGDLFRTDEYLGDNRHLDSPREPYFDIDFLPAVEALFRKETSDPRTRSTDQCPFRIGSGWAENSLAPTCECPASHTLVKTLGSGIPRCSQDRCPVRIVLST